MISFYHESPEVLYAEAGIAVLGTEEIAELKRLACQTRRRRCRICFHSSPSALLHEMVIVHEKNAWVPPHMHVGKSESIQVLEGSAEIVSFTDSGKINDVLRIGEGGVNFCRLPENLFHTLLIDTDWLVFKETILGPFNSSQNIMAPWAPTAEGAEAQQYIEQLRLKLQNLESNI